MLLTEWICSLIHSTNPLPPIPSASDSIKAAKWKTWVVTRRHCNKKWPFFSNVDISLAYQGLFHTQKMKEDHQLHLASEDATTIPVKQFKIKIEENIYHAKRIWNGIILTEFIKWYSKSEQGFFEHPSKLTASNNSVLLPIGTIHMWTPWGPLNYMLLLDKSVLYFIWP